MIDGEVVALGDDGRPSFSRLQHRMHVSNQREARRRALADPVSFVAFDLLYVDGHLLLEDSYDERRSRLESLHLAGESFTTTDFVPRMSRARTSSMPPRRTDSKGVVAKRRDAPYRPGRRTPDWVKVKSFRTQEIVIGGWTEGRGERQGDLGALLLGVPGADRPGKHVGKVGTGFSERRGRNSSNDLRLLMTTSSPSRPAPPGGVKRRTQYFVRPDMVGEVAYGEWTAAGRTRHLGLALACDPTRRPIRWSWNEPCQHVDPSHRHRWTRAVRLHPWDKRVLPRAWLHQGPTHRVLRAHRRRHAPPRQGTIN